MKNKSRVAIIYQNSGIEAEISIQTSQSVAKALDQLPYTYFLVKADENLIPTLLTEKPDLAFLATHGIYGEDGCLQSICEFLSLPYTGSGVLASALCMDKLFFKKILIQNKLATPDFQIVDEDWNPKKISKFPVVVKASHGGSTLGTYISNDFRSVSTCIQEVKKIGRSVFIETYIPSGQEIAVSYLQGQILTPLEIKPKGGFYDYKRKYEKGQSTYHIPAQLDDFTLEKLKLISEKIFSLVDVRNYARIDFLVENGKTPWALEINTLPGLTETSLLPKSAKYDGIDFVQLIQKILNCATTDYPVLKK